MFTIIIFFFKYSNAVSFSLLTHRLSKQLETQKTATLHQLYGDCLREMGDTSHSMEQYNKALRLGK